MREMMMMSKMKINEKRSKDHLPSIKNQNLSRESYLTMIKTNEKSHVSENCVFLQIFYGSKNVENCEILGIF